MSSSMLEQAIVDAAALKEAAVKNAEALVIEKYAKEIKEAVDSLLDEAPEDEPMMDLGPEAEMGEVPAGPQASELDPTANKLPDSFKDVEAEGPITIDLEQLSAEVEQAMGEFESHEDAAEDVEGLALEEPPTGQAPAQEVPDVPLAEGVDADLDEKRLKYRPVGKAARIGHAVGDVASRVVTEPAGYIAKLAGQAMGSDEGGKWDQAVDSAKNAVGHVAGAIPAAAGAVVDTAAAFGASKDPKNHDLQNPLKNNLDDENKKEWEKQFKESIEQELRDEGLEINENTLYDLLEKMVIDAEPTPSGWMNRPEAEVQHEADLAAPQEEEVAEEVEEVEETDGNDNFRAQLAEVNGQNEILATAGLKLQNENEKLRKAFYNLKETLENTNLSNAKLLYINQTLTNASLNERQKQKIVEAISKTETVKEAKVIFETLQGTVGTSSEKKQPQSLSEVATRKASLLVTASRNQKQTENNSPFFDRMQKLAGIK